MLARALAGGTRLIGLLRRAKQLRQADRAQLERQRRRRRVWMRRRLGAQPHCRSRPVRRNGGHAELGLVPAQGKCVPFEPPGDSRMALLQSLQQPCNAPTGLAWGTHWRWSASMSSRKLSESKNPSESSLRGTNQGTQGTHVQYSQCLTVRCGLFSVPAAEGDEEGAFGMDVDRLAEVLEQSDHEELLAIEGRVHARCNRATMEHPRQPRAIHAACIVHQELGRAPRANRGGAA